MKLPQIFNSVYVFYKDGFKAMTVGKSLWILVTIKLFIMFFVLRIFFFPNYLKTHFPDDASRAKHVSEELINTK